MVGGEGGVDRADARLLVSSAIILGTVIMVKIKSSNIQPASSIILKGLNGEIHYMDSFNSRIENKNNYSIDYLTALLFSSVPKWAKLLLRIRDFIVNILGRIYLAIIMPFHKLIMKTMLTSLCKTLQQIKT